MKKTLTTLLSLLLSLMVMAQDPTVTPTSFTPQTEITVVYDVSGTALADLDAAYIWVWIPDTNIDAKYNINPASSNSSLTDNAKFTKSTEGGVTLFTISFKPEDFFTEPICLENQLGMLIKGDDWSNGQSADFVNAMTPLESCFVVNLLSPTDNPAFVDAGENLTVSAESSDPATFTLTVDNTQVDQQTSLTAYTFQYTVPQVEGLVPVSLNISDSENDTTIQFSYLVNFPSSELSRAEGVIPGINYDPQDHTKATLCLLAPGKKTAYALGEFNAFDIDPANKMYKDGDYFWMEITGLTAGEEYAFQYLVDGVYIADPYADKILDPDDFGISNEIYPNLKSYPAGGRHGEWYKNRLSIIQTNQAAFNWQNANFAKPEKSDLVIYELLIRDFFSAEERNYQSLKDTLTYLKRLGINAIELMPIQEFAGNNSWGYNPTFMFAPDKAYGTKKALKEFIDAAHGQGIAVILDVVFNQQDIPNAFLAMWYDFNNYRPTADNPMFNENATHPYSVFFDMNHESEMTKNYMDTTLHYWINEYQVDGYRFDLSKGFTQKNSGTNVSTWGQYDPSRIALLKRMHDKVREYSSDSYLILEHFADNSEEKELANHGFMLWGNMHWDYKDLMKGLSKNIAWGYHGTRGWDEPNVVSYMESHDEERLMYEYLVDGTTDQRQNPSKRREALDRIKQAHAFFYTMPGPKMLWQFGELGYDESINLCTDNVTVSDDCRTATKPVKWELAENTESLRLYEFTQALIDLKTSYDVFKTGQFSMTNSDNLIKEIKLIDANNTASPTSADQMSVYVIGNFDTESQTTLMELPMTGTWYDFFDGGAAMEVTETTVPITLAPGHFRLFVNFQIPFPEAGLQPVVTAVGDDLHAEQAFSIYPNPVNDLLNIKLNQASHGMAQVQILDMSGRVVMSQSNRELKSMNISQLTTGLYIVKVTTDNQIFTQQFIKKQP